ncbi:HIT family protein [Catellatospora chokoriensis]|uniref:HIT family protein n=1 Tax=Catellatospora chokoriensis TaxID=310353 RepID=A0A8J3NNF3_9ACTN|nr:HIT domain-containing protein [Catellatospora chokoriensis]GIF86920.1 HIT family protein [Catellatospora chokoriensis]
MPECPFCLPAVEPQIVLSDQWCYSAFTQDTGTPVGSAMVLPLAHRPTVFDLTEQEWASTASLLHQMKEIITAEYSPDGWNVGWNVQTVGGQSIPHAHCHLVPRYADEPLAGRGIRSWIKDPANRPPRAQLPPVAR